MGLTRPDEPQAAGVVFPEVDGHRSTSAAGRAVLAAASRSVDPDLAAAIEGERDWRRGYLAHMRTLVAAELRNPDAAPQVPRAGLDALHTSFAFVRNGEEIALERVLADVPPEELHTARVDGRGERRGLAVPYRGAELAGDGLLRQLDRWVAAGTVEPSFAEAVRRVAADPERLDLSGRTVVVLGAGAEMGPLTALTGWGATLALADLPRPQLWSRILRTVRAGCGRALVPLRHPVAEDADDDTLAEAAGVDLVTGIPELARWIEGIDGPLVLGNYAYAHGAAHTRVAMAADALAAHLADRRADLALAGLLTPTDVYAVPEDVVEDARARLERTPPARRLVRGLTGGRAFAPNYEDTIATGAGKRFGIVDCLVTQQGPNYALAKRLQRWRLRLARDRGIPVSANVAPATGTRSVTENRLLAAAYAGAPRFDVEVFDPATSNMLMAALLVHDLTEAGTAGDPATPLVHPLELFCEAAAHGGMWRQPFAPRSVLPVAALVGFPRAR